ncbi:MbtH protein [Streptomyces griseochromogenes]|uniref:Antibiotic synthesis protein MbtH n=1 Tax=Streptomyces griseochromogenes TaxID=68214 RepID=A0A1B1AZW4_9ACTN|nr:MbtH family NRPS accessory protein [Streptomyces griseochromogenes]ANP52052.1 antibiotic synthesis protein MbtH [Streptomyces griseochromogenes]MBP2056266.1 MbtH protein [Streptomyces griseochromogenes]
MFDIEGSEFRVVRNNEEQYSIWATHRELPAGWFEVGSRGSKTECLAYIERSWTNMRPASLRRSLSGDEGTAA